MFSSQVFVRRKSYKFKICFGKRQIVKIPKLLMIFSIFPIRCILKIIIIYFRVKRHNVIFASSAFHFTYFEMYQKNAETDTFLFKFCHWYLHKMHNTWNRIYISIFGNKNDRMMNLIFIDVLWSLEIAWLEIKIILLEIILIS